MNNSRDIGNKNKQNDDSTNPNLLDPGSENLHSGECVDQGAEAVELSLPDLNELGLEDVDESYPFC